MAIKIDLIPAYVGMRRRFRALLWGAMGLLGSVATILGLLYYKGQQELGVLNTNLENVETNARIAEKAKTATETATNEAAPVETVVSFIAAASKSGAERAVLLDMIGRYIYSDAVVTAIDISDGQNVNITATVKTPQDYKRFLLNLRRGSATWGGPLFAADPKSNAVVASGVPGFPASKPVIPTPGLEPQIIAYPLAVTAVGVLKDKVVVPAEPGGTAPTSTEGAPPVP
ncbi:MAG TPA: hypothetical protein VF719_06650 [Abditibacteriaceae bacterium]|jgi:hypothetical protein